MSNSSEPKRRLRMVPLAKMKVSPLAQRDLNPARVDHLANRFNRDAFDTPTVNERDGAFYVIDGQHRIEALKQLGGESSVQCWTYSGLTEEEEAEMFLVLNDKLTVPALPRFKVSIKAGREVESDIDRIVRANGLVVSKEKVPGAIGCPNTLIKCYCRSDSVTLARTLRISRDAFGDSGLEANLIDGISLLCERYNGSLDDAYAVQRLARMNGGANGLLGNATKLRLKTGSPKAHCVAAAAVEVIGKGVGGKKLASWWAAEA